MRKVFGALIILLSGILTACFRLRKKRQEIVMQRALCASLHTMRAELSERQRGLGEIFAELSERGGSGEVRAFYLLLREKMKLLGELSFAQIWRTAAEESFAAANESVRETLLPLGEFLGGSGLEKQCRMLESAASRLEKTADESRDKLAQENRMSFGFSLAAASFIIIMLM